MFKFGNDVGNNFDRSGHKTFKRIHFKKFLDTKHLNGKIFETFLNTSSKEGHF